MNITDEYVEDKSDITFHRGPKHDKNQSEVPQIEQLEEEFENEEEFKVEEEKQAP